MKFDILAQKLIPHYSKFDVGNRLLFSGHSHQAWPDVALEGQVEAFEAAAALVDGKWAEAFEKTEILRGYLRNYYDDPRGRYCLATSTHELLVKWLSALDLRTKPKIVTTDAEFYTVFRQLRRLEEEGLDVREIPSLPLAGFTERLESELDDKTSAVIISRVYFESSLINSEITDVAALCRHHGIPLLIDDYHGTNVIPLSITQAELQDCYLLLGGYKYLQWGEGNCFLRFPEDSSLRPVVTGWFASFSTLNKPRDVYTVEYEGDQRFSAATYDSTSQYRAARVAGFFDEMGLTPSILSETYRARVSYLKERFLKLDLDPSLVTLCHDYPIQDNAGFLSLRSPMAARLQENLKQKGVYTDSRGEILRFGPAPYSTSAQIEEAMEILKTVAK